MKKLILNFRILCLLNSFGYSQQKKDPAWVTEGREAFNKQEHRFEFEGPILRYNGKVFHLNQPIRSIVKVLGPYDRTCDSTVFIWDEKGIYLTGNPDTNNDPVIVSMQIAFKPFEAPEDLFSEIVAKMDGYQVAKQKGPIILC